MFTDPIADMLTRIRNASLVHKKEVVVPFSKMKKSIAEILVREGYVREVEEQTDVHPFLVIKLKYADGQPVLQHLKRISKPGGRVYIKRDEIKEVLNGFGIAILSTPQGIMTNKEARAKNVGGELLCEIY
jgi:small subunit ribosomal protein S8